MDIGQIRKIIDRDPRYPLQAYLFVFEALEFTLKRLKQRRHVTGKELLEGIREYALQEFGGLAKMVFNQWNVNSTEDFGEIVFNLVEAGLMGKTETDSKNDFKNGYNFDDAFSIK
jgi:uncharacterized repeat protein (TIGR04138 family)